MEQSWRISFVSFAVDGLESLFENELEAGSFENPPAGSVRYKGSAGILPAGSGGILPPVSSFQTGS
jgi:hypothetical protein